MPTTNLEKEKIAESDKHELRKANTLGSGNSAIEEPFGNSEILLRRDFWSETPTADTSFASPDYGDGYDIDGYEGDAFFGNTFAVATRSIRVRLHPLITSGTSGPNSIQTFVAVRFAPVSDDPVDIEAVRIRHLVPPDLSPNRTNADDNDPNTRGFELALFPAIDDGGTLDAYDSYGPIPVTADPTAVNGVGSDARWTVDYANGIVRLSGAPLNGTTGVFNPNNVYGDINGNTVSSATGRLVLFATFYRYTGPSLLDGDEVGLAIVGDGYDSYGNFYGPTSTVMQRAIDSLAPSGGTVFLKEGNYNYVSTVNVPANVNILGLSHNASITKPGTAPAFRMQGDNSSIKGVSIFGRADFGSSRASVEIGATSAKEHLDNITIEDNHFWTSNLEPAIGIRPLNSASSDNVYRNVTIKDNVFRPFSTSARVTYLDEISSSGNVTLDNFKIIGNSFIGESAAIDFVGEVIDKINGMDIADSYVSGQADIDINTGTVVDRLYMSNNKDFQSFNVYGLRESTATNNTLGPFTAGAGGVRNSTISENLMSDVSLDGYVSSSRFSTNQTNMFELLGRVADFSFSQNECSGVTRFSINGSTGDLTALNLDISNNKIHDELVLSNSLSSSGAHRLHNIKISDNIVDLAIVFASETESSVGSLTYSNLRITNNLVGDSFLQEAMVFGDTILSGGSPVLTTLENVVIDSNSFAGNVRIRNTQQISVQEGVRFTNNTFITAGRGLFVDPVDASNINISNNRLSYISLLDSPNAALAADTILSNIVINGNSIRGDDGYIIIQPSVNTSASALILQDVQIDNNVFEDAGIIGVLFTPNPTSTTRVYDISGLSVCGNKLYAAGSRISIYDDSTSYVLGAASDANRVTICDNVVDGPLTFVGVSSTNSQISNNSVYDTLRLSATQENLVCSDNLMSSGWFTGDIAQATINGNNVYEFGWTFDSDFENVTFTDNAVDGYVVFNSTITNSTFTSNTILGGFSDSSNSVVFTSFIGSTFSNNTLSGNLSSTAWTTSALSGNRMGVLTATTLTNAKFTGNTLSSISITSLSTRSSIDNNLTFSTTGGIAISGAVTLSNINNNVTKFVTVGGTVTDSTISGNTAEYLALVALTRSNVGGNSMVGSNVIAPVDITGAIADSVISNNLFSSTSATLDCNFGAMTDTVFDGNNIEIGASADIIFSDLTSSTISNCHLENTSAVVTIGALVSSSISNCEIVSTTISIPETSTGLVSSNITGCHFTGDFSVTTSVSSSTTILNSSISNNVFGGAVDFSSTDIVFNNSVMSDNTIIDNTAINVTLAGGTFALLDSTVSGNKFGGTFNMNNSSGGATGADLISESTISDNSVTGLSVWGTGLNTSAAGSIILNSTISGNRFTGANTIGPVGRSDTLSSYLGSTIGNNTMAGITMRGALSLCNVSGNVIGGTVTLGQLLSSACNDNTLGTGASTITLAGGMASGGTFNDNVVQGALVLSAAIADSSILGNTIVSFASSITVSDCNISNNIFIGGPTLSGTSIDGLIFGSNVLGALATISATSASNIVITGNRSTAGLTASSPTFFNSSISNNVLTGTLTISGNTLVANLAISSNRLTGLTYTGSSTGVNFDVTGNQVDGAMNFTDLADSVISGNAVQSTTDLDALTDSVISDNSLDGTVTVTGTVTRCSVSGNVMFSAATPSATFSGDIAASTISSNRFGSATGGLTLSGSSVSTTAFIGNSVVGSLIISNTTDNVNISGNILVSVTFPASSTRTTFVDNNVSSTFSTTGSGLHDNLNLSNNYLGAISSSTRFSECSIDDNTVAGASAFTSSLTAAYIFFFTSISGNSFQVCDIDFSGDSAANDAALRHSTFSDNSISSTLDIDSSVAATKHAMYRSVVSGNIVNGATTISSANTASQATVLDSVISHNVFNAGVTITHTSTTGNVMRSSVVSDNVCSTAMTIASSLSGASGLALDDTIISNNQFRIGITIGNGSRDGDVETFTDSAISGNRVGTNLIMYGRLSACSISGNHLMSAVTLGKVDSCVISDNSVLGAVTLGSNANDTATVSLTTITGNSFESTFDCTTGQVADTTISGNEFFGTISTDGWDDVAFTGNSLTALTVSEPGSPFIRALTNVVFSGNSAAGAVSFTTASAAGSAEFLRASFTGNNFNGAVIFGTAVAVNHGFNTIVFSNNTGSAGVEFSSTATSFPGVVIIGNSMQGTLTMDAGSSIPSPPTSSQHPTVALNTFSSYSGFTFDDTKAIGWGDNLTADTISAPGVVGGNQ